MCHRIHGDRWAGVLNHEWHLDAPTFDDVNRALDRLDAKIYTMLTLQGVGEQQMTIGGGAGRYIVYATSENEEFWNLLRPAAGDDIVFLNAGGQEGDYPARQVVNIVQARAAARKFFAQQQRDPDQTWERQ